MATLNARLSALDMTASPKLPRLLLFLMRHAEAQPGSDDTITGIRADAEHTTALQRQQGETDEGTDRPRQSDDYRQWRAVGGVLARPSGFPNTVGRVGKTSRISDASF